LRIPPTPPRTPEIFQKYAEQPNRLIELIQSGIGGKPTGAYLHWDELRHRPAPPGFSHEEWWLATKLARQPMARPLLLLRDKAGRSFSYCAPDSVQSLLHEVDRNAAGDIQIPELVTTPQNRDRYIVRSLMEEAITSSQLEGAATTHKIAKDMLQRKRKPRDKSEQMIMNNYAAMQFIRDRYRQALTPGIILELQRILTTETLDDASAAGRWRRPDEDITVADIRSNETLHIPPAAAEIPARMDLLCQFANDRSDEPFVHPVVRAILLHFMLGYDHPFVDGNGRTARALFYWCMAQRGYWLIEFVSISRVIMRARAQYVRAYLHTETDDGDTTYFLLHQLNALKQTIAELQEYLRRKVEEQRHAQRLIEHSPALQERLNHRQLALLDHALRHPKSVYRIDRHRSSHHVTYQTARTDLLALVDLGLLAKSKAGRAFIFTAPEDLRARLEALKSGGPVTAAGRLR
jgi:Fic family protein